MRNLIAVPTKERSCFYTDIYSKLKKSPEPLHWKNAVHVHIISEEAIKDGDWCLDSNNIAFQHERPFPISIGQRKIMFSSHPKLLEKGVNPIPDDVLQGLLNSK